MENTEKQTNYVINKLQELVIMKYIQLSAKFQNRRVDTSGLTYKQIERNVRLNRLVYIDDVFDVRFKIMDREYETYIVKWFQIDNQYKTDDQVKELRDRLSVQGELNFDEI